MIKYRLCTFVAYRLLKGTGFITLQNVIKPVTDDRGIFKMLRNYSNKIRVDRVEERRFHREYGIDLYLDR